MIVLYGAGATGRYALKHLRSKGVTNVVFTDSDAMKWGEKVDGVQVEGPMNCYRKFPAAEWVASAISRPAAQEIRALLKTIGVRTKPVWECLPVCHGLPSKRVMAELLDIGADAPSWRELADQFKFRANPNYDIQQPASPMSELYFPNFITHRDDEHFVDCGAADGDTVKAFMDRWEKYGWITAIEPDSKNYEKIYKSFLRDKLPRILWSAVTDFTGEVGFTSTGDYSAHVVGTEKVPAMRIDSLEGIGPVPTYIKMDIEGSELEALWGARRTLAEHKPVLAICAYHKSEDLWKIPLLIHALQPEYKLFFRRYAEGAYEIVWYAVPPERIIPRVPASHESYSDNHEG